MKLMYDFKVPLFYGAKIQFYFIFVVILNEVLSMRIDQYLWCIRLYKSRNIANSVCKKGMIKLNGQKVKPSREILPLDYIEIRKEQIWRKFQILDIPKTRMGAKLVSLYIIERTDPSVFEIKTGVPFAID